MADEDACPCPDFVSVISDAVVEGKLNLEQTVRLIIATVPSTYHTRADSGMSVPGPMDLIHLRQYLQTNDLLPAGDVPRVHGGITLPVPTEEALIPASTGIPGGVYRYPSTNFISLDLEAKCGDMDLLEPLVSSRKKYMFQNERKRKRRTRNKTENSMTKAKKSKILAANKTRRERRISKKIEEVAKQKRDTQLSTNKKKKKKYKKYHNTRARVDNEPDKENDPPTREVRKLENVPVKDISMCLASPNDTIIDVMSSLHISKTTVFREVTNLSNVCMADIKNAVAAANDYGS